ncbi:Outer membrane protein II* [Serratia rubidaea]|uniref:Outer membrane protein A n=1 Tax=Serratia rubidaea TaxID=61652 RepID=A0A4U9HT02_SERRU|nr:porin OmpA [Serratia rubidaea]QPR64283.1 porin OmpA [Serratia rubidaea]CAI1068572.1 Outer membrane protein II* [Serratia rubidaea]CAI1881839.1 Outer membrane protein II* [Serratia rubidaea]VTP67025.1 Outer membrane protein II* [Serratia rubidaea]HAY0638358.1 porin OmpA [Serratia rubidaea]
MKKTTAALSLVLAAFTAGAQAAGQPESWYAGIKAGWSDYYNASIPQGFSPDAVGGSRYGIKGSNAVGGVFLGYQANDWLALEGGYDYLGNMEITSSNGSGGRLKAQGIQLGVKLSAPLTASWDVYARGGAMGWRSDVQRAGGSTVDTGLSPMAALGTELALSDNLALRLEYQYTANVGEGGGSGVTADNGQTSLGLLYRFGAPEQTAAPIVPPREPELEVKTITLKADTLFAFNRADLTPDGLQEVQIVAEGLRAQRLDNLRVDVYGYTDRLGAADYNLDLSQRRARTVAEALSDSGISPANINARGMGISDAMTGSQCDGVHQRDALIDCLSPERRVDINVRGESAYVF